MDLAPKGKGLSRLKFRLAANIKVNAAVSNGFFKLATLARASNYGKQDRSK